MDASTLKGIVSAGLGGIVFFILFYLNIIELSSFASLWLFIAALISGYTVFSPFIMTKNERKQFEAKFNILFGEQDPTN